MKTDDEKNQATAAFMAEFAKWSQWLRGIFEAWPTLAEEQRAELLKLITADLEGMPLPLLEALGKACGLQLGTRVVPAE